MGSLQDMSDSKEAFEQWYLNTYYTSHGLAAPTSLFDKYEDTYLNQDVYRQNLSWQSRQAEVNQLQAQINEMAEVGLGQESALLKKDKWIEKALYLIDQFHCEGRLECLDEVEKALRGES